MTLITAHEGCEGSPSNTLESVQAGINAGADIIEVDVRSTKDSIAVLSHCSFIETKSGNKRPISEYLFDDLLKMEKNNEIAFEQPDGKITKLVEVFELIRSSNRILNLDVKDDESIDPLINVVKNEDMLDYVFISGCERIRASYLKKNYPEFQVLFNVGESLSKLAEMDYLSSVRTICRHATQAGCCGINIPYQFCSEELVNYAHLRFLPVSVWTIDNTDKMKEYLNMKVYSITTKRPAKLRKIVDGY